MNTSENLYFWTTIIFLAYSFVVTYQLFYLLKKFHLVKTRDKFSNALEWPYIEEQAEMMVKRCRRYQQNASVLMVDGDSLRKIFDDFGASVGSKALAHLGETVYRVVREVDLFGRFASGKYIICLTNTDINGAVVVAERLRQAIFEHQRETLSGYCTISIGCAQLQQLENLEQVIARANTALARAQELGGNRVSSSKNCEAPDRQDAVWPNLKEL